MSLTSALQRLLSEMNTVDASVIHDDTIVSAGKYKIIPDNFREILPTSNPGKIVFIDGGNGVIYQSPRHAVVINRLYACAFRGDTRVKEFPHTRVQYYSLITRKGNSVDTMSYDVKLFTDQSNQHMPDEEDVASAILYRPWDNTRVLSSARSLGEWRMACNVIDTLEEGDVIVKDGSLMAIGPTEESYAEQLFEAARSRGVIVCTLSKTSDKLTRGGEPLLEHVKNVSKEVGFGMWYIEVAENMTEYDRGFVMAIRLHQAADRVYRFDILREQYEEMSVQEREHVLSSVAANSGDIVYLGYPYGLIDADRWAQVRIEDIIINRQSMIYGQGTSIDEAYFGSVAMHEYLNEVTG